jgi:ectoine hydroxylase-related dioxygenase (phytanoyl-CoA dioxygenase family)
LTAALGEGFGLVRALYFDKPPGNTWALPWHKDLTVAVKDNRLGGAHFARPTRKAGVPHAEAPVGVLERMLTARIHLDRVDDENGPLKVVPGSHRAGKELALDAGPVVTLHAGAGDVLLIRPLVAHCSNRSRDDTTRHRRILHLEFASGAELPGGYVWHDFVR